MPGLRRRQLGGARPAAELAIVEPQADEEGNVDIDLGETNQDNDDDGGDDDEGSDATEQPVEGQSRQEKKRSRWMELKARNEELESKYRDESARRAATEQAAVMLQRQQQVQAPQQPHPIDQELARVKQMHDSLVTEFNSLAPEQARTRHQEFRDRMWQLENERISLASRRMMPQQGAQQDGPQQVLRTMITAAYPDVVNNKPVLQWAIGEHARLVASGAPDDWTTIDRAAQRARQEFKLPSAKRSEPQPQERERLTGTGKGSALGAGPRTVRLSALEQRMARQAFPHLKSDGERFKRFAQEKLRDEQEEARNKKA